MSSGSSASRLLQNEPMAKHTSWRVGGPASFFAIATDVEDIRRTLEFAAEKELEILTIGAGTNLLVSDSGFDGVVLHLSGGFRDITIDGDIVQAGAGASLSAIAKTTAKLGLDGLVFAYGIPGDIGGALAMNAGAFGESVGDVTRSVQIYTAKVEIETIDRADIDFGYRTSSLDVENIIIKAEFRLKKSDRSMLKIKMDEHNKIRKRTQPLGERTAGSVFKNPQGRHAAILIEEAGCKGMTVGGAMVSKVHTNFIVNEGKASGKDIYELMMRVAERVRKYSGIILEPEVRLVGKF